MSTIQDVRHYLEGVSLPARPEDLLVAARANGAPQGFFEILGLLPTAMDFRSLDEVAYQLQRLKGLG